jgi:hypothetical protein
MNAFCLRRLSLVGAVSWLCLSFATFLPAGQIYFESGNSPAEPGAAPALLSDATRSMAAAPIQVFDTPRATPAESPGASVAGVDSLGGSLIGTLTLAPELERRNPLLARQCKAAFARLADAPVYADAPLMHSMSEAQRQIELTLARGEAIAVLGVGEFSAGSFAMISTVVHEQRSRLLAGLEYLNL